MENEQKESTPVNPQPATQDASKGAVNINKKTSPWVWVIGGCLIISILAGIMLIFLGWLGFNKAKDEIKKQQPNFEEFKSDMEDVSKEAQEWEKKSQELRDSLPNPEDLTYPTPADENTPVLN